MFLFSKCKFKGKDQKGENYLFLKNILMGTPLKLK